MKDDLFVWPVRRFLQGQIGDVANVYAVEPATTGV